MWEPGSHSDWVLAWPALKDKMARWDGGVAVSYSSPWSYGSKVARPHSVCPLCVGGLQCLSRAAAA